MEALLFRVGVVTRCLQRLDGDALVQASHLQAQSIQRDIEKLRVVSLENFDILHLKFSQAPLAPEDRRMLEEVLQSKTVTASGRKRPQQDGTSLCTAYLTRRVADAATNDETATIFRHFNALGLINASEPTCAKIAAVVAVARWGPECATTAPDYQLQHQYYAAKKELKKQYRREPLEYVLDYPLTALEFLQQHPKMAKMVFSAKQLPISCPFNEAAIDLVFRRIQQRGWVQKKDQAEAVHRMAKTRMQKRSYSSDSISSAVSTAMLAPEEPVEPTSAELPRWFPGPVTVPPSAAPLPPTVPPVSAVAVVPTPQQASHNNDRIRPFFVWNLFFEIQLLFV